MTIDQYYKWAKEIKDQADLIIATQQYERICQVFIQDVWLDTRPGFEISVAQKADVMMNLQSHFVK